jgi:hypothetical protein
MLELEQWEGAIKLTGLIGNMHGKTISELHQAGPWMKAASVYQIEQWEQEACKRAYVWTTTDPDTHALRYFITRKGRKAYKDYCNCEKAKTPTELFNAFKQIE